MSCWPAARRSCSRVLGRRASASRSQPYYLDITHPMANKGVAVRPARRLDGRADRRDRGDRRRPQRRRHVRAKRPQHRHGQRPARCPEARRASSLPQTTRTASPRPSGPISSTHDPTASRSPRRCRRTRPARGRPHARGGTREEWRVLRRSVGRLDAQASLPAPRHHCPSPGRGHIGSGATSASCLRTIPPATTG